MRNIYSVLFPLAIIGPTIFFWMHSIMGGYNMRPSELSETEGVIGGSKLPTMISCFGFSYSPNMIGIWILFVSLLLYISVFVYWSNRARCDRTMELAQGDITELDRASRESLIESGREVEEIQGGGVGVIDGVLPK